MYFLNAAMLLAGIGPVDMHRLMHRLHWEDKDP
jgi:hypothetical protein